jgi:hypothetical protein
MLGTNPGMGSGDWDVSILLSVSSPGLSRRSIAARLSGALALCLSILGCAGIQGGPGITAGMGRSAAKSRQERLSAHSVIFT